MSEKQAVSGAIWFPWQRAIRTALQVVAALIIGTASILAVVSLVAPQMLAAVRDLLRPEDYALLVGWVAAIASLSAALSRIMAIPQVDAFLKRFGAGSSPASVPEHGSLEAAADRLGVDPNVLTRDQYRDTLEE